MKQDTEGLTMLLDSAIEEGLQRYLKEHHLKQEYSDSQIKQTMHNYFSYYAAIHEGKPADKLNDFISLDLFNMFDRLYNDGKGALPL